MSYPWTEHEVFLDGRPEHDGRHLRCVRANGDGVAFIDLDGSDVRGPEWLPREAADELAKRRQLVRVDGAEYDPEPILEEHEYEDWPQKRRAAYQAKLAKADAWADVISALVAVPREAFLDPSPERREAALSRAAAATGKPVPRIRYWCCRYYGAGRTKAGLMPAFQKCGKRRDGGPRQIVRLLGRPRKNHGESKGRRTGVNVDAATLERFAWAANQYVKKKWTWQKCFEAMIRKFHRKKEIGPDGKPVLDAKGNVVYVPNDVPEPTFRQFYYASVAKAADPDAILRKLVGPTGWAVSHAPRTGSSQGLAAAPAELYAIDATLCDLYLLSDDRREVIGRPVMYLVIDYFSQMIAGFYLGLENPGWTPCALALRNAFVDKAAYCADLGVAIGGAEWPAGGYVCRKLMFDRAPENVGDDMAKGMLRLGVERVVCPPARPDWKGLVEGSINMINIDLVNPDARQANPREMDVRPEPGDATLTLRELELKFVHWICMYNAKQRVGRKQWPTGFVSKGAASALEIWAWGRANRRAPQAKSELEIALALMRHDKVTPTQRGLHLGKQLYYECDDPAIRAKLNHVKGRRSEQLDFLRDDRTVNRGLVVVGKRVFPATLAPISRASRDLSMFEFQRRYREDAVAVESQRPSREALEYRARDALDAIDAGAAAATARAAAGRPDDRWPNIPRARRAAMAGIHGKATVAGAPSPPAPLPSPLPAAPPARRASASLYPRRPMT